MRKITEIIIHCAATPPDRNIGVKEIRVWHLDRGFDDVGYHYVIRRNGIVEEGRAVEVAGAHVLNHNAHSIGICLVGGVDAKGRAQDNFTSEQMMALERLVRLLKATYDKATVHGHREFAPKDCPSFDVQTWLKDNNI